MPETMLGLKRSGYCSEFSLKDDGKEITVCGWVQKIRDLGQIIFIDLRDRSGIIQLAFDDSSDRDQFKKASEVRSEYVIAAKGVIRERSSKNKDIPTGDIELAVNDLRILSKAETPPFEINAGENVNEELRLRYRYLDLRRKSLQDNIIMRHKIAKTARDYFDDNGFVEIETPILIRSTPEGARDYLVPSRIFPGSFFALPQSPQLYKQLTMLSGFDRYMQIARCFRDEDLRADRQPEFTQIDFEMSFSEMQDVMDMAEGFIKSVYKKVLNKELKIPFKTIKYIDAMNKYGSDKPDLRFGMEIYNVSDVLLNTEFKVFGGAISSGGIVAGINVKDGANKLSRKEIDKLVEFVKGYGVKGLAYTKINQDGTSSSSYEKFLSSEETLGIRNTLGAENGDVLLIIADSSRELALSSLGSLRCEIASRLDIIDKSEPNFVWVIDFPLFEYDNEEKRFVAKHHPFTSPSDESIEFLESEPEKVYAKAYDLVLDGNEIGGGSIRINNPEIQKRMFKAMGFSEDDVKQRFGFLVESFKYGAPPHGGMAFGLDRLVMLMLGRDTIRDVIAFPKAASSGELMTQAPSGVDKRQLDELGISLNKK